MPCPRDRHLPRQDGRTGLRVAGYDGKRYSGAALIRSFACRETERLFHDEAARRLPRNIQQAARRKLMMLNQARRREDLCSPPGNRLEALRGDREGQSSIRINDQWRVCFRWEGSDAFEVEIVDYH